MAVDSSVAVPLLVRTHGEHRLVSAWWRSLPSPELALAGHAAAETYSVLTRLPADARLEPGDAARLIKLRFSPVVTLPAQAQSGVIDTMAGLGIQGGAVYDALVALAAAAHGLPLASRDRRARSTYDSVGVRVVEVV